MRVLLIGGSKSGKSSLAQTTVIKLSHMGHAYYWAAMEPVDAEDDERIERHIADRDGLGFITIERGKNILEGKLPGKDDSLLFDSVTALLANEMFQESFDPDASERVLNDLLELSTQCQNFVCVADDIFRDGAAYDAMTESYRLGLALILRALAKEFDVVAEVFCGKANLFKGVLPE